MRILITGVSGFIGSNIYNVLKKNHEVYGIATNMKFSEESVILTDLLNLEETKRELEKRKVFEVDILIHLAAILAVKDNLNDIEVLNQNNRLSYNAGQLAKYLKVKKIINFSSSSVYPNIDGEFSEESQINPSKNADAFYGLSKYSSEVILDKIAGDNISVSHLRCSMVFGKGVNSDRLWPVMEKELKDRNTITVYGNGERLINQIHISSLVGVVSRFIEENNKGVYNINEETISVKELAERLLREKGNQNSKIVEVESGNRYKFRLSNKKYEQLK